MAYLASSPYQFAIARQTSPTQGEHFALVPWWSITKLVLAVATVRLAEMGSLDLDDRFDDWPFTIRQVLQHRAGLANYGGLEYEKAVANGEPVWSVAELLARRNARQLLFPPGEGWAYSNIAYWSRLEIKQLDRRFAGVKLKEPTDYPFGREVHITDPGGVWTSPHLLESLVDDPDCLG